MAESKFWCFTLNNYGEGEYTDIQGWDFTYIVVGKEKGENGTPHLQGYVEFTKKKRITTLKKLNSRIHWERRKGTAQQAADYCKKDGDFWESGEISKGQGTRTDLECLPRLCLNKGTIRKVLGSTEMSISQIRTAEKYFTYLEPKREWKPEVTWIWGASGVGKTRMAYEKAAGEDIYEKDGEKWWDGYDGHETVIMDDFRASNMKFNYLLKLLDRYPMRVEFKGGYRQMLAKKFYITTIVHPEQVYQISDEPLKQLIRRIDNIIFLREEIDGPRFIEGALVSKEEILEEVGGNTVAPTSSTGCETPSHLIADLDDVLFCDEVLMDFSDDDIAPDSGSACADPRTALI